MYRWDIGTRTCIYFVVNETNLYDMHEILKYVFGYEFKMEIDVTICMKDPNVLLNLSSACMVRTNEPYAIMIPGSRVVTEWYQSPRF